MIRGQKQETPNAAIRFYKKAQLIKKQWKGIEVKKLNYIEYGKEVSWRVFNKPCGRLCE